MCPYFVARSNIGKADAVIFSYQYVIDPKASEMVMSEVRPDSIVVFDEAHNIDNVCVEALSVHYDMRAQERAEEGYNALARLVNDSLASTQERLEAEYRRLAAGVQRARAETASAAGDLRAEPIPQELLETFEGAVPGNIRQAKYFMEYLKTFLAYLRERLSKVEASVLSPLEWVHTFEKEYSVPVEGLRLMASRLALLLGTLEVDHYAEYADLATAADLATLVGATGAAQEDTPQYKVVEEPRQEVDEVSRPASVSFCCLDAAPIFEVVRGRFRSVVVTSGTLSPLEMYAKLLRVEPSVAARVRVTLPRGRECVLPVVLSKGNDQVAITSKKRTLLDEYNSGRGEELASKPIVRNYGNVLVELSAVVPDGIVGFFPSYNFMDQMVTEWNSEGILNSVLTNKLVFFETTNPRESTVALHNYKVACDCGRGGVLLAVARGKFSEGIDFANQYGRCVIMFGTPFMDTRNLVFTARTEYLYAAYHIRMGDFLTFDAVRAAAQCVGRTIRGKTDYAMMVFADSRYVRSPVRGKLPAWISSFLTRARIGLSTESVETLARTFYREMGQPFSQEEQLGTSLWTVDDIARNKDALAKQGIY